MAVQASPSMYDSTDLLSQPSRHQRTPSLPAIRHNSLPTAYPPYQSFSYDPMYDPAHQPKHDPSSYSYPSRSAFQPQALDYDEPPFHQVDRALSSQWGSNLFKLDAGDSPWEGPFDNNQLEYDHTLSLSPASNRSSFTSSSSGASAAHQLSPSLSPIDLRTTRDLPRLSRSVASPESAHNILPALVPGDYEHSDGFTPPSGVPTLVPAQQQPPKHDKAKIHDPDAAAFLQERLGSAKWSTFSARLFDKRLSSSRTRRGEDDDGSSLSVYSFLVKVEAVKEVLRTLVPHPYNPEKTADHPFPRCAKGYVRLTRETVLSLAGWSNTQFSYWMRRVEAIAVFAPHDATLRAMKAVLLRMLYPSSVPPPSPSSPPPSPLETPNITGKGLDALIDEIKRRTGASQFLRGKHASLDAFCAAEHAPAAAASASPTFPTFHAQMYSHEQRVADQARRKRKRAESDAQAYARVSISDGLQLPSPPTSVGGGIGLGLPPLGAEDPDVQPVGRIAGGALRTLLMDPLDASPSSQLGGPQQQQQQQNQNQQPTFPIAPYAFPLSHARGADGIHGHKRVRTIG